MLKVGVVGATGYAGEEVIKILVNHKGVKITELSSRASPGRSLKWMRPSKPI